MYKRKEIIGDAVLYCGDCLEVMPSLGKVDAVVTDPPYGINWKPRVNHQDQEWIDEINFDILDFLKIGEYHLFWGGNYFADRLPVSNGWLTWCKRPLHCDFSEDKRTYSTTELAWRDWGKTAYKAIVWDGGKRQGAAENRTFCHPAQKPIEIMTWCVRLLPFGVRTILDPFMGSGTTGVAAVKEGRKFIGIELDDKYFDIACKRIDQAQRQGKLFTPPKAKPKEISLF